MTIFQGCFGGIGNNVHKCLEDSIHSVHGSSDACYHNQTSTDSIFRETKGKTQISFFHQNTDDKTHNGKGY